MRQSVSLWCVWHWCWRWHWHRLYVLGNSNSRISSIITQSQSSLNGWSNVAFTDRQSSRDECKLSLSLSLSISQSIMSNCAPNWASLIALILPGQVHSFACSSCPWLVSWHSGKLANLSIPTKMPVCLVVVCTVRNYSLIGFIGCKWVLLQQCEWWYRIE